MLSPETGAKERPVLSSAEFRLLRECGVPDSTIVDVVIAEGLTQELKSQILNNIVPNMVEAVEGVLVKMGMSVREIRNGIAQRIVPYIMEGLDKDMRAQLLLMGFTPMQIELAIELRGSLIAKAILEEDLKSLRNFGSTGRNSQKDGTVRNKPTNR